MRVVGRARDALWLAGSRLPPVDATAAWSALPSELSRTMHAISAETAKSAFVDTPHLVIAVDGRPLDLVLDAHRPQGDLKGLVPTLLDWLEDEGERAVVRDRVLPPIGETAVAPILMCPDDLDFFCTVVVAEVETSAEAVQWTRLGLDMSE